MKDELTGRSEEVEEDEEEEEEETASSRKRCMTPRVSSILGFPEEKGKACVRDESEDDMEVEVEVEVESPEIIAGGGRDTSSFDGPAISVTVVEVVGMTGCKRPEFSLPLAGDTSYKWLCVGFFFFF